MEIVWIVRENFVEHESMHSFVEVNGNRKKLLIIRRKGCEYYKIYLGDVLLNDGYDDLVEAKEYCEKIINYLK